MGVSEAGFAKLSFRRTPMQVFGLPGHLIRNGRAASRLLDAQTPDIEAARRGLSGILCAGP
jgi:hypothetical protein